jgi:hypothetical protein
MPTAARKLAVFCVCTALSAWTTGCNVGQPEISYLGDADFDHYKSQATEIDYPVVHTTPSDELAGSFKPHTIRDREHTEIRDMSLAEALHTALMNSDVIRSAATFQSIGNPLFTNPNGVDSVYDSAIQQSGVLFGARGVEAALSDFDAQFTSRLNFGGNRQWTNGITALVDEETGSFENSLTKFFANGGTVQVNNNINYVGSNRPLQIFDSVYSGQLQFLYQQPLLAGAGTAYTRTAGPIARSFGGITGVSQGVLIARINNDIVLADFETATRNLLLDVENVYWDLYFAYRAYDTTVVARNSALDAWRLAKKQAGEVVIPADEAQARNGYYAARTASQNAQSAIFSAETRLRRLLAMSINDGTVIRPIDEPVTAEIVPDWSTSLADAMTRRVELRRQKWNIKSLQLQLAAAKSLTRSRLDFISGYQINAFGNHLLDSDEGSNPPPDSYFHSLAEAETTGWSAGLQMAIPVGFRAALAQVRNYELRVAKAHKVLAAQELEIGHELAIAMQELDRTFETMRSNYYRFIAAEDDVRLREPRYKNGEELIDVILRAYERRAQAEAEYYRSVVEYNKAIANLQMRRGTLLDYDNVQLMEGYWDPPAYADAERQAWARSFAIPDETRFHSPPVIASPVPLDEVRFATPILPDSATQDSYNPPPATVEPPADSQEMPVGETAPDVPEAVDP